MADKYTLRQGVTQSMLRDFKDCRERYRLKINKWQKKGPKSKYLIFGSRFHELMESLYKDVASGKGWNPYGLNIRELLQRYDNECTSQEDELELSKIEATWKGYTDWYQSIDEELGFCAVEQTFTIPSKTLNTKKLKTIDRWIPSRKGKIDALVYKKGFWLFESKTRSQLTDETMHLEASLDFQRPFYLTAVNQLVRSELKGVMANYIRNPGLRPRKYDKPSDFFKRIIEDIQSRPEHYFKRQEVIYSKQEIGQFSKELNVELVELVKWHKDGITYRNTNSCYGKGKCEFIDFCSTRTSVGYSQDRILHEELKEGGFDVSANQNVEWEKIKSTEEGYSKNKSNITSGRETEGDN